jgi:hypothetical protein
MLLHLQRELLLRSTTLPVCHGDDEDVQAHTGSSQISSPVIGSMVVPTGWRSAAIVVDGAIAIVAICAQISAGVGRAGGARDDRRCPPATKCRVPSRDVLDHSLARFQRAGLARRFCTVRSGRRRPPRWGPTAGSRPRLRPARCPALRVILGQPRNKAPLDKRLGQCLERAPCPSARDIFQDLIDLLDLVGWQRLWVKNAHVAIHQEKVSTQLDRDALSRNGTSFSESARPCAHSGPLSKPSALLLRSDPLGPRAWPQSIPLGCLPEHITETAKLSFRIAYPPTRDRHGRFHPNLPAWSPGQEGATPSCLRQTMPPLSHCRSRPTRHPCRSTSLS